MTLDIERRTLHPDVAARATNAAVRRDLATRLHRSQIRTDDGDLLELTAGRTIGLNGELGSGMTRLGLGLLAEAARQAPVVAIDARGWISPLAAWEVGIAPERFIIVRADQTTWAQVVGSLMDGVKAVYAEVPRGIPEGVIRRIVATARNKRVGIILRPLHGRLPAGLAHLTIDARIVEWEGAEQGHGHITRRSLHVTASGKAASGIERTIEVEDDGTNTLRVVGRLATPSARRTAG